MECDLMSCAAEGMQPCSDTSCVRCLKWYLVFHSNCFWSGVKNGNSFFKREGGGGSFQSSALFFLSHCIYTFALSLGWVKAYEYSEHIEPFLL